MRSIMIRIAPIILLLCYSVTTPQGINGTVTVAGTGAPLGGVRMDGLPSTPYTNTDGFYAMAIPSGWSGTVIPMMQGYAFTPASVTYSNVTDIQYGQNYVATPVQVQNSIYGTVTAAGTGAPLGGVRMDGLPSTPYTNTDGVYAMLVPSGWSGTVTPVLSGYTFTPANRSYTDVTVMQPDQNFVGTPVPGKYLITGTVRLQGIGEPIANVYFPGPMNTSYSNGNGVYSLWVPAGWTGTITPGHSFIADYTFTPISRSYTNVTASLQNEDYVAIPPAQQWVNGRVSVAGTGAGLAGVLLDGLPVTTYTIGGGMYHSQVPRGWSGVVTPRLAGYTFTPENRTYSNVIANSAQENYTASPMTGDLDGTITSGGVALSGVTVKLLDEQGLPVAGFESAMTDGAGHYTFHNVPAGGYQVMIVEPWGYAADQNPVPASIGPGATSEVDFALSTLVASNNAANWSYWKNQYDKAVKGQKTDVTPADLSGYIASIQEHYTAHFSLFGSAATIADWQAVLSKSGHSKEDDALAELAALLMNFSSLKLGQYTLITKDDHTAGDVLTYVSGLIANPGSTDKELEQAKKLAQKANQGTRIEAGLISSAGVLYKGGSKKVMWGFDSPTSFALFDNYPNPFNPSTTIRYGLPRGSKVTLIVYNALGQEVATLVNEAQEAGYHEVRFDASGLASGAYFYRLQAAGLTLTKKLLLLR